MEMNDTNGLPYFSEFYISMRQNFNFRGTNFAEIIFADH